MAPINYFLQKKNFNRVQCFNIDQLDIEDNEEEFSLSKQQYKSKSMKQEYIENLLPETCKKLLPKIGNNDDNYWKDKIEMPTPYMITIPSPLYGEEPFFQRAKSKECNNSIQFTFKSPEFIYSRLMVYCCPDVKAIGDSTIRYIDAIMTKGDMNISQNYPLGISGWDENENYNPFWMSYLKRYVPVMLVPQEMMPVYPINDDQSMESLGCYFPKKDIGPMIYLCPEKIERMSTKELPIMVLYAIVLMHEYAHAIMDETNVLSTPNIAGDVACCKRLPIKQLDINEIYMEESLANMITLQYVESAIPEYSETIESFMKRQPAPYALGVDLYEANKNDIQIDWRKWRTYKSNKTKTNRKLNKWKTFADKYNLSKIDKNDIVNTFNTALS